MCRWKRLPHPTFPPPDHSDTTPPPDGHRHAHFPGGRRPSPTQIPPHDTSAAAAAFPTGLHSGRGCCRFSPAFFCQPYTQPFVTASTRYLLSLVSVTRQGCFRALSPSMAASSSMRLLVVIGSPPESSFSCPLYRRIAPQPPGPGVPEQAPSVKLHLFFCHGVVLRFCAIIYINIIAHLGRDAT